MSNSDNRHHIPPGINDIPNEFLDSTASAPLPPPPEDDGSDDDSCIDLHITNPPPIEPTTETGTTQSPILDFAPPENLTHFPTLKPPIPGNRPRKSIDISTIRRSPLPPQTTPALVTPQIATSDPEISHVPTNPVFDTLPSFKASSGDLSVGTLNSTASSFSNFSAVSGTYDDMLPPSQLFGTMSFGDSPELSSRIGSIYASDIQPPATDPSISPRPSSTPSSPEDDDSTSPLPPPDVLPADLQNIHDIDNTNNTQYTDTDVDLDDVPLPPPDDDPPSPLTPSPNGILAHQHHAHPSAISLVSQHPHDTDTEIETLLLSPLGTTTSTPNSNSSDYISTTNDPENPQHLSSDPGQGQMQLRPPTPLSGSKAPSVSWKTVVIADDINTIDDTLVEQELARLYGQIPPPTSGGKMTAIQYNMRLKCTVREGESFEYRNWNLSPDQLLQFGFGVGLYFYLTIFALRISLYAFCLNIPIAVYHFLTGTVIWSSNFQGFVTFLLKTSFGNYPNPSDPLYDNHFLWNFISDITSSILVLFFLFKFVRFVETKFEITKVNIPTASDFTVAVTNPPHNAIDPEEYAQYFSRWGTVINVTLGFNHGNLAKLARERSSLIESIKSLSTEIDNDTTADTINTLSTDVDSTKKKRRATIDVDDFEIFLDLNDPHPYGKGFFTPFLRKIGFKRDLQFFKGRLLELDLLLKKLLKEKYNVCRVYVTFSQRLEAYHCFAKLYKPSRIKRLWLWLTNSCRKPTRFYGRKLYVERAGEPSDIHWANIHYSTPFLLFRQFITTIATVLIVIGSFLGILYLSSFQNNDVYVRVGIALLIVLINKALIIVMRALGVFEKHPSHSTMMRGIMTKTFLFQFINTAFIPFLVGNIQANNVSLDLNLTLSDLLFPSPEWYPQMVPQILSIVTLDALLSPLLRLVLPVYRFNTLVLTQFNSNQANLNYLYRPPPWMISEYYANSMKMLFVCLFYSTVHPIIFGIYFIGFAISFQTEKLLLLRLCRKPSSISRNITKLAAYIAVFSVPIKMFSAILFYTYFINTSTFASPSLIFIIILIVAIIFLVVSILFISGDFLTRYFCSSISSMQPTETKNIFYSQVPNIERYLPPELPPPDAFERSGKTLEIEEEDVVQTQTPKGSEMANPTPKTSRSYHASSRLSMSNTSKHRKSILKDQIFSVLSDGRTQQGTFLRTDLFTSDPNISEFVSSLPLQGQLTIYVENCSSLPKFNNRVPNVNFKVRLINSATARVSKFKSKKSIKSTDPEWKKQDARFTFEDVYVSDITGAIKLEIFSGKQPIGQIGSIPFSMLLHNGDLEFIKTFELEPTPGQKYKVGGFMRISFIWLSKEDMKPDVTEETLEVSLPPDVEMETFVKTDDPTDVQA